MEGMLKGAWKYRQFILNSIKNDFRARFARSKLGGFWMVLHPLAQVLMYAAVLSAVLSAKLPGMDSRFAYALYITAGILAWTLFTDLISRCLTLFIENANLLKKVAFPKICLPLIAAGSAVLNSLILLTCILVIFVLMGHQLTVHIVWLPLLILITVGMGLGLGLILGVMNVFIRDVGQAVPILLQFGFWFTPIVYMVDIIPEGYRGLLFINPMYHLVSSFQNVLVFHRQPDSTGIWIVVAVALLLLFLALFMFKKAAPEMVDEL